MAAEGGPAAAGGGASGTSSPSGGGTSSSPTFVFCYGSNGREQLCERVENEDLVSFKAHLPGYTRLYAGWSSRWGGAVASVMRVDHDPPAEHEVHEAFHAVVHGSVVPLMDHELEMLDVFEGIADSSQAFHPSPSVNVYRREWVETVVEIPVSHCRSLLPDHAAALSGSGSAATDGADLVSLTIKAIAYVKNDMRWHGPPSSSYLEACWRNISQFWEHDHFPVQDHSGHVHLKYAPHVPVPTPVRVRPPPVEDLKDESAHPSI